MPIFNVKDIRTCSGDEKDSQLAEFKGQLIDIFESFLDERGIVIPNPERDEDEDLDPEESANIYGSDYDELADKLMDTLEKWGLLKPEITVDTPAGKLVAYGNVGTTPGVGITLLPKDSDGYEIDLALAETKTEELLDDRDDREKLDSVFVYTYGNPYSEDYTNKHIITRESIKNALEIEE